MFKQILVVTDGSALSAEAILGCAHDEHCDAIVMASHGRRGLDALLLGSETRKVLAHAAIPVIVTRPKPA